MCSPTLTHPLDVPFSISPTSTPHLSAGIVDKPADLDVATVMSMGFPAYRGGVVFYGDIVGAGLYGTMEGKECLGVCWWYCTGMASLSLDAP